MLPVAGAVKLTGAPAMGVAKESVTLTTKGWPRGRPTVPVWPEPETAAMLAAAPALAVALNETGEPVKVPEVAVKVCAPAPWPSVPIAEVVPSAAVGAATVTLPVTGAAKATAVPETGFPNRSVTLTTNGCASAAPTVPVCPEPETAASALANPATTVVLCVVVAAGIVAMVAVTVRAPAVTSVRFAVPEPSASGAPGGEKPGSLEVKFTVPVKLVQALLKRSNAANDTGAATPAVTLAGSPVIESVAGVPALAWALNDAVPVTPATEALKLVAPEMVGSVPFAEVVPSGAVGAATVTLPVAGAAKLTVTPATGLANESVTFTTKACASATPTVPAWPEPETAAMLAAAPAVAV